MATTRTLGERARPGIRRMTVASRARRRGLRVIAELRSFVRREGAVLLLAGLAFWSHARAMTPPILVWLILRAARLPRAARVLLVTATVAALIGLRVDAAAPPPVTPPSGAR